MRKELKVWLNFQVGAKNPDVFFHEEVAKCVGQNHNDLWAHYGFHGKRVFPIATPALVIYDYDERKED